jgi:hypothetical protein
MLRSVVGYCVFLKEVRISRSNHGIAGEESGVAVIGM